ncbi:MULTISPECIES: hypothetical protein [unclassified Bradyrhizobium]|uniref:hypothetical protein n=1 Tax=unclassified Bradyrhizobium TaxID=2631580 RepID=UPI0028E4AC2E|nr:MULTISPECIES: hypothetical protein [unclassified Bradyrhizobium]
MTAGAGPIPSIALEVQLLPIENLEEQLCRLPVVSSYRLLVGVPRPDSFIALCERGLFVYDWTDVHRTGKNETGGYELVAIPDAPIGSSRLPAELLDVADTLKLSATLFGGERTVAIRSLLKCVEAR